MKTYCKGLTIDRDLVEKAFGEWKSHESGHKNYHRVKKEYGSDGALIDEIANEISSRTLRFRPIRRSDRVDGTNGKVRTIGVASIKQQVCDYVCVIAMNDLLRAKAGFYQTANEEGKGTAMCRRAIKKWSLTERYFIKADVRKCYPSMKTDMVMRTLGKYVRSDDVLYVVDAIFGTYDGCLEIGSYLSLKLAQFILSFPYHFLKDLHKVRRDRRKRLISHQIWHLDDMIITGSCKRDLKMAMRAVERYMRSEFGLEFKPWKVCRVSFSERLDLGGWVAYEGKAYLRGKLFLRGTRAFARFDRERTLARARRVVSYWGWFKHSDCSVLIRERDMRRIHKEACSLISRVMRKRRNDSQHIGKPAVNGAG